jgi:hypothetical protein
MSVAEMHEEIQGMSSGELEALRIECREDLFFLCFGILGYREMTLQAHGALCQFMVAEPQQRRLVLMPRGHFKSSICTVGDSIRLPLKNPNIRILIINETATNAEGFLTEIKQHWTNNQLLRDLFPELIPEKLIGPGSWWRQDQACLNRTAIYKEPTWSALGVGGAAVSRHFNRIKADDLAGEAAKASDTIMKATVAWNRSIEPLLTRHTIDSEDMIDWIGTRKGLYDLYADIMARYRNLAIFSREPIEDGKPILPSMFSIERFHEMMETAPEEWMSDYMNNPMGDGQQTWGARALRDFAIVGRAVRYKDDLGDLYEWTIDDLDRFTIVDQNAGDKGPKKVDKAAVVTYGVSPLNQIFTLETFSGRPNPDELLDVTIRQLQTWGSRAVGFEKAGQQNLKFHFLKCCKELRKFWTIVDLMPGNMEKKKRIKDALDTPIRQSKFFTLREQTELRSQLFRYPQLPEHDWDLIDTTGYIPQIQVNVMPEAERQVNQKVRKTILSMRGRTGYGRSVR